jgi:negative regulator of sigma-B (phosphoserine phosphatase)
MEPVNGGPAGVRDDGPLIEYGAASRPLPGERDNGDRHVVQRFPGGVLVAAVDGLGHGAPAASAAEIAAEVLEASAREPIDQIVRECHDRLWGTRGVVLSLGSLRLEDGRMTWMGVGNVEGSVLRPPDAEGGPARRVANLIATPGIVGYRLPAAHPRNVDLRPGDVVVLATDGIEPGFAENLYLAGSAQNIADRTLERHATGADDALVVVLRLPGGSV